MKEYVELKYCPFCHYDEHLQVLDDIEYTNRGESKYYWVDCDYCGACGPHGIDKDDAIKEWNSWCVDPRSSWDDRHDCSGNKIWTYQAISWTANISLNIQWLKALGRNYK